MKLFLLIASCVYAGRLTYFAPGLGACGGGAHADTEYINVSKMGERAALAAAITRALVNS